MVSRTFPDLEMILLKDSDVCSRDADERRDAAADPSPTLRATGVHLQSQHEPKLRKDICRSEMSLSRLFIWLVRCSVSRMLSEAGVPESRSPGARSGRLVERSARLYV
ncbi:hypothetical protein EYF80_055332 [Liparis tanakae]|uniref:Uncharacterized protein n=1 Tax=Liparis tanakae TaxID=230148 RepID=A0A4Z2F0M3_9TELE|nr:hypothetical protein EYF80_055332 [Liparis tanakae]